MRIGECTRKTKETDITITLNIDGTGTSNIQTGIGFFDHLLTSFCKHGRFDLTVRALGDLHIDGHHTVEDIGIVLGQAFFKAIGDKKGIERFGFQVTPMDDALIQTAVDLGGRPYLVCNCPFPTERVGEFDTELVREFLQALSNEMAANIHVIKYHGENSHHIAEAIFKSLGRSLKEALTIQEAYKNEVPSTKGVL